MADYAIAAALTASASGAANITPTVPPRPGAELWANVENAAGTVLGGGPLTNIASWQYTRRLSRAGAFSLSIPASEPQALHVQVRRILHFYEYNHRGQLIDHGRGVIESVNASVSATGQVTLLVTGSDLLRELADILITDLDLWEQETVHPALVFDVEDGGSYRDERETYDGAVGDTDTYADIDTINTGYNYLYISDPQRFDRITFKFQSVNSKASVMRYEYTQAGAGFAGELTLTADTTVDGTKPFGQDGYVTFEIPDDWDVGELGLFGIRISADDIDTVNLYDIAISRYVPTANALTLLEAYFPAAWSLDTVDGYDTTASIETTGSDLVTQGGFEAITGTPDDGSTDTFTGWTTVADAGCYVDATATAQAGSYAVKLYSAGSYANVSIYQDITVTADTWYLLSWQGRGDGALGGYVRVLDNTHTTGAGANELAWLTEYNSAATGAAYTAGTRRFYTPVGCTSIRIVLSGPYAAAAGYALFDAVTLYALARDGLVQLNISDETVLEALIKVADYTGQQFIAHPTARQVRWIGADEDVSGIRAVAGVDPFGVANQDDLALLVTLAEEQAGYELATRVYPFGGGFGDSRPTLAACTLSAPAGYTLSTTDNYIKRDAAETALGRIDKRLDLTDLTVLSSNADHTAHAANTLFQRALTWLETHSATSTDRITGDVPRLYNATLAKCRATLLPGQTLRVDYTEYDNSGGVAPGRVLLQVAGALRIMATVTAQTPDGAQTVACELGAVAAWPDSDAALIVRELRNARQQRSRDAAAADVRILAQAIESQEHSALLGLSADDHTQYLLASGARTGAVSQAQTFTSGIVTGSIKPTSNSTTAIQLQNVAGTAIVNVDTTNQRVGVKNTAPTYELDVTGNVAASNNFVLTANNSYLRGRRTDSTLVSIIGIDATDTVRLISPGAGFGFNFVSAGGVVIARYENAGNIGFGTASPQTNFHFLKAAGTAATNTLFTIGLNRAVATVAGFGSQIKWQLKSSTTDDQDAAALTVQWQTSTHATRAAEMILAVNDYGGVREGLRIRATGSAAAVGVFGVTPQARPAAYTQTYSTATRTHSNPTAAALTDSSGGTPAATLAAITGGGSACENATKNAVASLAAQVNALIVDMANVKQVVNQALDDLQGYGWLQ